MMRHKSGHKTHSSVKYLHNLTSLLYATVPSQVNIKYLEGEIERLDKLWTKNKLLNIVNLKSVKCDLINDASECVESNNCEYNVTKGECDPIQTKIRTLVYEAGSDLYTLFIDKEKGNIPPPRFGNAKIIPEIKGKEGVEILPFVHFFLIGFIYACYFPFTGLGRNESKTKRIKKILEIFSKLVDVKVGKFSKETNIDILNSELAKYCKKIVQNVFGNFRILNYGKSTSNSPTKLQINQTERAAMTTIVLKVQKLLKNAQETSVIKRELQELYRIVNRKFTPKHIISGYIQNIKKNYLGKDNIIDDIWSDLQLGKMGGRSRKRKTPRKISKRKTPRKISKRKTPRKISKRKTPRKISKRKRSKRKTPRKTPRKTRSRKRKTRSRKRKTRKRSKK